MKRIVSFTGVLMFLLPVFVMAESFGKIEGRVTDKETGKTLPLVNIIVKRTTLGAATGEDGRYFMVNIPTGKYKVMATMMGYKPVTKEASVSAGEISVLNFELQESVIEMGGIVVTGTRTPRYIKNTPVRTEVITSRRFKERGVPNLYEALEGVPGIRIEQQCSYCNFSMVRVQGLGSGHTQILIDGQPIYSGLASVYGAQQVPSGNMDRIEIVKGSGSALYGSSAIGGVINIITKKPGREPSVNASVNFGTANTNEYTLSASRKYGNMDIVVDAQKNTGDGIDEDGDGCTDRVKTDNLAFGTRLNVYNVLGNDKLTFSGRTLNELRQGGELATWENPFSASTENIKTTRYEVGIGYKKKFQYGNETTLDLNYCTHNRNATNDGFLGDYMDTHGDTVPPVDEMQPYLADENLYVVDWNYSQPIGGMHRLLAGVQYSYNELNESGRYVSVDTSDPNYGDPYTAKSKKYAHDIGVYLQDEFSIISEVLELVLGVRYDIHRSKDDFRGSGKVAPAEPCTLTYKEEAFSPRFALMYRMSPEFALRASVGTGFRVPYGFSEDLHLCSGSPRVNKPAGLKPEKSMSFNFGADYSAEKFTVNASIFRTNLKDKIDFTDASEASAKLGYTYEWANIGKAYTQGVEAGLRAILVRDISLDLNLTYTDAQYEKERDDWIDHPVHGNKYAEDSRHISRVPEITGGIGLSYTPGNWSLALSGDYTGSMYIDYCKDEDVEQPESYIKHTDPFWVMNGRIGRKFAEQGITIFAGAKNLFNYVQDEKHPDDAAFMYAPYTGRIIYGGIEIRI
ncbi:TonB-dependent receptor [candidate division WOR-3 bacterium]|nr:TonB-dependent receptor [candidate division WOR-3 bacterium]